MDVLKEPINENNTFIFVIIGLNALKETKSFNERNVKKYFDYSLSSYAVLIKRLAKQHHHINEKNISIFAKVPKGKEISDYYNIQTIYKEIVVQLTIDEIYTSDPYESDLNFIPFEDIDQLLISMQSLLGNCRNPNIFLYMYDHGNKMKFAGINFLDIYFKLSSIPHSQLYIFNDSSKSNWMIKKINFYFVLSEAIKSSNKQISSKDLLFLASVANELYPQSSEFDAICSLDNRYYEYISKTNNLSFFYLLNQDTTNNNLMIGTFDRFLKDFPYEYKNLIAIVNCYKAISIPDSYKEIHDIFMKGAEIIKKALNDLKYTNYDFLHSLKDIIEIKSNFPNTLHERHNNHFIFTSSHENGYSPTFCTIKISDNKKIAAGSPAMGAYIIESLINQSLGNFNLNEVKRMVYGTKNDYIMEYACQHPGDSESGRKKRAWVRLFINRWESSSIIDQNPNYIETKAVNVKDIMESVGFHLRSSCEINYYIKNNYFYCSTPKMEPFVKQKTKAKTHKIPVRLASLSEESNYDNLSVEDEQYYSDDIDIINSGELSAHSSTENISDSTSSEDIILDDYNRKINNLDSIKKKIKNLDHMLFPEAVYNAFEYELEEVKKSSSFKYSATGKNIQGIPPIDIMSTLESWIDNFFPTYELFNYNDKLLSLYYNFMTLYQISGEDLKNIFCHCLNVADQVASSLNHDLAYDDSRIIKDSVSNENI